MVDLVSMGTISIDLYLRGEKFPYDNQNFVLKIGAKYNADYLHEGVGGGGVNVAGAAIQGGLSAAVLGFIGDNPFKDVLLTRIRQLNISSKYIQIKDEYLNFSSILLTDSGERTIINYRPSYDSLHREDFNPTPLLSAKAFYLGNLPDVPITERVKFLSFVKNNNNLVFLNLGAKDCARKHDELNKLLESIDVIILNRQEFSSLVEKTPEEIDLNVSIFHIAPILRGKKVIITDSDKGSFGYENDLVNYQEVVKPERIIDTTGAGDAYTGAFIAEYLNKKDLSQAMKKGAEYASEIIGRIGAN